MQTPDRSDKGYACIYLSCVIFIYCLCLHNIWIKLLINMGCYSDDFSRRNNFRCRKSGWVLLSLHASLNGVYTIFMYVYIIYNSNPRYTCGFIAVTRQGGIIFQTRKSGWLSVSLNASLSGVGSIFFVFLYDISINQTLLNMGLYGADYLRWNNFQVDKNRVKCWCHLTPVWVALTPFFVYVYIIYNENPNTGFYGGDYKKRNTYLWTKLGMSVSVTGRKISQSLELGVSVGVTWRVS